MKQHYTLTKRLAASSLLIFFSCFGVSAQTYVVNSTLDDGSPGTLRDAINQVNAPLSTITTIHFDFSAMGAGPYTITLGSDLPAIAPATGNPIVIDGYSEPASTAAAIAARTISVQITGNATANNGLTIGASDITVDGLAIYNCKKNGINILTGNSNINIWGNYIGTDATGLGGSMGEGNTGILIGSSPSGTPNNAITIGTNGDGTSDDFEGNLIVSNGAGGITDGGIIAFVTTNSRFSGNIIGLGKDAATTSQLFNNGTGILLSDQCTGNVIGTNGDGTSDALEGNYLSNNGKSGIWLFSKSNNNTVAGNIIGLTAGGANALNVSFGIIIDNSSGNTIGTNADGISDVLEKNFVANNLSGGIQIKSGNIGGGFDQNADDNIISGNTIGVAQDGTTAAGNAGNGVEIAALTTFTASNNVIGANGGINESFKGNIIANNSSSGISIQDVSNTNLAVGNRFSRNLIYNNLVAGINLINPGSIGSSGITANSSAGFGSGPNGLLNFPVITSVTASGNNVVINGFARQGAILEFYTSDKTATMPAPSAGLNKNFGGANKFLFQAIQGGTMNGITDAGTNVAGSYTTTDEGTGSGTSPITSDYTFSYSVPAGTLGLAPGSYSFSMLAIDAGNTSGNINNTSSFGGNVDGDLTTLPITLIDFTAHSNGTSVVLLWSTSSEVNNSYFGIERSGDGKNFTALGQVDGKLNSTQVSSYTFTDVSPLPGISYYRLRQVDVDGKSSYSKILTLHNDPAGNSIKLFPTLFHNNLNLSINTSSDDQLTVSLVDQSGRIVLTNALTTAKGLNSFNLNNGFEGLAPGIYFIRVTGKTVSFSQKLLKE